MINFYTPSHSQLIHMQIKTSASQAFACSVVMSETTSTPEPETGPVASTTPPPERTYVEGEPRRSRLTAVAAWVGIVAGVVFIVAVIFFSGFILGAHAGGHRGGHHGGGDRDFAIFHRGPPPMFPMGPGPRGEFERPGPGFGPGGPGSQPPQAPQSPTTTAPARP
jgi:hypothetical protein